MNSSVKMNHYNGLTPAEAERLAILAEECGEVIQAIGKILRHGFESSHPDAPKGSTNRVHLEKEIGDLLAATLMLRDAGDVRGVNIQARKELKQATIKKYLHHQNDEAGQP